jgi:hypothetical protein
MRKRDYDASLGRKVSGDDRRPSMEDLLLSSKAVDADQMAKARNFSKAVGVEIRDALMQQKLVKPELVMPAYAESIGLPYLDLNDFAIDESLVRRVPAAIARTHSCVPVLIDANQLLMASPNPIDPQVEEELRLRFSMPIRLVLCSPASVNELINKHYSRESIEAERAAGGPVVADGSGSASRAAPAPDTPEAAKQRKMIALMSFNFTFVIYQFALAMLGRSGWGMFFLGFPLAAIVGGSVWMVVNSKRK